MSGETELWQIAPGELSLPSNRIDVWKLGLDTPEPRGRAPLELLSPDEVSRAERFHFPRDRMRFVKCRAALRDTLGRYMSLHPAEIRFRYEKNGKPEIADARKSNGLRFNVSHSAGMAVIAVASGRAVGVDIEKFDREVDCLEVAQRFFSKRECEALLTVPSSDRQRAFFACWTRKEAFLKATGEGISYSLAEFSVSVAPDDPARLEEVETDPYAVSRWSLKNLHPTAGYLGTLAFEGTSCWVERWCWDVTKSPS
jgi:4'-phosphopantetheinyl transferase